MIGYIANNSKNCLFSWIFRKTNKISNRFLTTIEANNLNNIITIYNQNNIVSYIATTKNRRGDLFIIANTENYENDTSRLIYAIKSDGTNFFSDNID